MSKPVIGITIGRRTTPKGEPPVNNLSCPIAYGRAVELSGGVPVLLPWSDDAEVIAAAMDRVDGLLLSGGGDVVPDEYGEERHPKTGREDPVRDRMEIEATRIAVDRAVPTFGICRGIQVLNVALGGTLVQDIPSQIDGTLRHSVPSGEGPFAHAIEVEPGSLLADVLAASTTDVNSRHHQAVKDVAEGLRINSRSDDGVIEGIEAADGRPILAVQCHPEDLCADHPRFRKLFDWLVAEAGRHGRRRT